MELDLSKAAPAAVAPVGHPDYSLGLNTSSFHAVIALMWYDLFQWFAVWIRSTKTSGRASGILSGQCFSKHLRTCVLLLFVGISLRPQAKCLHIACYFSYCYMHWMIDDPVNHKRGCTMLYCTWSHGCTEIIDDIHDLKSSKTCSWNLSDGQPPRSSVRWKRVHLPLQLEGLL